MSFFSKNNTDKKVKDKPKTFRDKSFEFIKICYLLQLQLC